MTSTLFVRDKADRVCPKPAAWRELYLLLETFRKSGSPPPPLPITGLMWYLMSNKEKKRRMQRQIEWAITNRCLTSLRSYLRSLEDQDWHWQQDPRKVDVQ